LNSRVTDPDRVLYTDEARDLEVKLDEISRTRALNFYLVIRSATLPVPASDLALAYQQTTVPDGVGGVILVSFADNSVSLFLSKETLKIVPEKKLMEILQRATESFSADRVDAENIDAMMTGVVDAVDALKEEDRRKSRLAPIVGVVVVTLGTGLVALIVAGIFVLRRQNLFGRAYYFRDQQSLPRFGGSKSGGHCVQMEFTPRRAEVVRR
jgi:hypothetical protein